jgi:hypothetical protein
VVRNCGYCTLLLVGGVQSGDLLMSLHDEGISVIIQRSRQQLLWVA